MRRPAPRSPRSLLRILLALVALLLAVALPAQADTADPLLAITAEDGQPPVTIPWSQLAGHLDADGVAYDSGTKTTPKGISLDSALALAGVAPETYSRVAAGANVSIGKIALIRHAAILFRSDDGRLQLLRSSAAVDDGPERLVEPAADGTLAVRLDRTPQLFPSMREVRPGGELTFYATLPAEIDPRTVVYEWEFNDGKNVQRTTTASVTRSFQARNRQDTPYDVSVTYYVNGARYDDMLPLSTRIDVVLSDEDKYKGERGRNAQQSSTRGRRRPDARQPSSRTPAETPPPEPAPTPSYTPDADGTDSDSGAVGTPTPTPAPAQTPPPQQPRRAPAKTRRATVAPPAPAGETVDGYLLASADIAPALAGGAAEKERLQQLKAPAPDDKPLDVPTPVWVAIGLLALVVLGWGLESRTTLPYFRP
ncbi:hypothetical protein Q5424_12740 [Conexibacter sp. JD483]|uniref:hypothetical protein n=1 Tax=unclassified Conexibacter TaxID=2627773 RepID=UPI00271876D7|nr:MULTISPECIES: hypothetical protein [unclassified Conexibacter]MDO8186865.1 hypothetical protein [Conexibacter sp. CPCC 205706]MDO8200823.1 hypothetical protein [Conexibacter sp. CPCC 205762]MDR9369959.1 hypothetical protein [Conexibacter sp. JD483]